MKPTIIFIVVEVISDEKGHLVEKNLQLDSCSTYEKAEKQIEDLQGKGILRNYAIKKCYMIYSK